MVNDEFEHAVPVRDPERDAILALSTSDRVKGREDMGIKHGERKLKVFDSRRRVPFARLWIKRRYTNRKHNLVVGSVMITTCLIPIIRKIMRGVINAENEGLLECPCGDIFGKLEIARPFASVVE